MSQLQRNRDIRAGIYVGWISIIPLIIAVIGWTTHWNVYINLSLTLATGVLMWTAIAVTLDRYQTKGE